jgi:uncharacterized protein YbjT (DUF2867 family)
MIVTLLGSSGLVGGYCKNILAKEDAVSKVILPVRTGTAHLPEHPKFEYADVDFAKLQQFSKLFAADAVICCLGTTLKEAGSKEGREYVDLKLPLSAAAIAKANGVNHFLCISAQGANASSWIHYSKTKGILEKGLELIRFPALTLVRPSLLMGKRTHKRRGEDLLKKILENRLQFIPEFWRPVHAETVARVLVQSLLNPHEGKQIIYNRKMVRAERAFWTNEKEDISK